MKKQENEVICANCGCVIEGETFNTIDGTVCSDCFYDDYVYCEDTDNYVSMRDAFYCDIDDVYVQYEENSIECACCGDRAYHDEWYRNTRDGLVCSHCFEYHYMYCWECDESVHEDEYDCEMDMCCDCASNQLITGYHSHDYDNASRSIGIELEVEGEYPNDMAKVVDSIINEHRHVMNFEYDGSLESGRGFEMITVPLKYETFQELPFNEVLKELQRGGFTSYENEHCGLHVHVSRDFFGNSTEERCKNIAKVINLFESNYDTFTTLSQRTRFQANDWARKYNFESYGETLYHVENCRAITDHCERYRAVNISNYDTVEYRLGRGTLNYSSFSAWIELMYLITINAQNVPSFLSDKLELYLSGASDNLKEYLNKKGVSICA